MKPRRLTKAEVIELTARVLEEPAPDLLTGLGRLFLALTCATTTDRDELLAARKAVRGDRVQFVYRGQTVTGRVVRAKKDGTLTVEIDVDEGEDDLWVDVKPDPSHSALRDYANWHDEEYLGNARNVTYRSQSTRHIVHCLDYRGRVLCGHREAAEAVPAAKFDTEPRRCKRCETKRTRQRGMARNGDVIPFEPRNPSRNPPRSEQQPFSSDEWVVVEKRLRRDGKLDFSDPQPPFDPMTFDRLYQLFFRHSPFSGSSASWNDLRDWLESQRFVVRAKTW